MTPRRAVALIASLSLAAGCADPPLSPSAGALPPSFSNAGRTYEPGEQQVVTDSEHGTWGISPIGMGEILAQTFTPTSNQWLGYLELPVGCTVGVLLNVKIREGIGGAVLYDGNVAGLPTGIDGAFQLIQVFDPTVSHNGIKLHKNDEYAFELAAFPGPDAVETVCAIAKGPTGSSYAGGRGYYQDPVNRPSFLPLPNGASTADEDLPFITLVR